MLRRTFGFGIGLIGVLSLLAIGSCTHSVQPQPRTEISAPPSLLQEECDPLPGQPRPGGSITVALADSIDPVHAPVPHNVSERMVFRNLYETLVRVECDGRLLPGLAESWHSLQDDRLWVFTLRRDVRFWDGTLLRAGHVKSSWIAAQGCPVSQSGHTPLLWLNAKAESVKVLDNRRLAITLPESQADFPLMLAHAALAVAITRPDWTWPVGTGACRLTAQTGMPDPDLICLPFDDHLRPPVWDRLVFRVLADRDARDLLGRECDALLIRDRSLLSYFESAPGVATTPLPWDRLYLLLCPLTGTEPERERWYTGWNRSDLARDVVAATAQPASDPFFLPPAQRLCPQMTGPVESLRWPAFSWESATASLDREFILHPANDDDARRLAERLAVLAARPLRPATQRPGRGALQPPWPPVGGAAPQAVAVPAEEFAGAVQSERAGAYLLPLDRRYPTACLQFSALLSTAHWLQSAGLNEDVRGSHFPQSARAAQPTLDFHLAEITQAANRLAARGVVVPLVVTRPYLVTQGRVVGLRLAYDGTPLWEQAGWSANTGNLP